MSTFLVWLFPIFSGVADAVAQTTMRLTKAHRFLLLAFGHLFAIPFYLVWWAYAGGSVLHWTFWVVIAIHVPLWAIALTLIVESRRIAPLTLTTPLQSVLMVLLLALSPLAGTGTPNGWGALGILILTFGLYVTVMSGAKADGERLGFLEPVRRVATDRGSRLMLYAQGISAITANLDLLALRRASAPVYLLVDHALIALVAAGLAVGYRRRHRMTEVEAEWRGSAFAFALFGAATALGVIAQMLALQWLQNVPYAVAGKRGGMIAFTFFAGLLISSGWWFGSRQAGEREDLRYRIIGTLLVLLGMLAIVFWGKA